MRSTQPDFVLLHLQDRQQSQPQVEQELYKLSYSNQYPFPETLQYNSRDQPVTHEHHHHVLSVNTTKKDEPQVESGKLKFYNFTVLSPDGKSKPTHLYGYFRLDEKNKFSFNGVNPIYKWFQIQYQIQVITIAGSDQPFTLIEGRRCKWMCDRRTKECDDSVCWESPSFCRGTHEDCVKLDGNGTCYDLQANGYPEKADHVWSSNSTHKVFTHIDVGRHEKYYSEDYPFISDDGKIQDMLKMGFFFTCDEVSPDSEHVLCYSIWGHVGMTTHLLKTIAG